MAKYSQAKRPMKVQTVLGKDGLLLEGFAGDEGISAPFHFTLDLLSEDPSVDGQKLLRTPASVSVELPGGGERLLHGLISRFVQLDRKGELTAYRAELRPWLWFLSLSADCRIFQNLSVLEIVEQVFKEQGYSDFQIKCTKSYPKREFCVQYRETHLNFVSRLLEDEGIFYFFEHSKDKHTLTLADGNSAATSCPGQATARMASMAGPWQGEDVVTAFQREQAVHTGKVTLRDYDYLQPTTQLESSVAGQGAAEAYDYPGSYTKPDEGDRYARLRLEEHETWAQVLRGTSTCRAFASGTRFDLKEHYRGDMNQSYMLVHVQHAGHGGGYGAWDSGSLDYQNSFVVIPHSVPFRPPRISRNVVARGSQTAVVVGKSGEEIWVDKHSRVKVQFYWDRKGKKDENSSCWVRVSSAWAGKNWGAVDIPRIGQEVIVDFLEGDPDRPIITGRVYNADQAPPYALPANQTQSGIKSRSSKSGGSDNCNEIRVEDKKGSEEILIHAEKDLKTEVENDENRQVGHDRTTVIENNDTRTVNKGNDAVTVKQGDQAVVLEMGNQQVTLKQGNQEVTLKMGNQTTTLDMGNLSAKTSLGKIAQEAMQGIELKVGQNTIKIDQTGVTIKGLMVSIEGQIQAELKGVMTSVKGDGMLTVKGGITMIN